MYLYLPFISVFYIVSMHSILHCLYAHSQGPTHSPHCHSNTDKHSLICSLTHNMHICLYGRYTPTLTCKLRLFCLSYILLPSSGGKSTQLSYLSKSKDTLKENDSTKSESHPVKCYLSKCLKVFGFLKKM